LRELEREPSVLLLDEPTAALAPAEIATLFATVVQLAKRGTAILVVTHKLQEVIDYTTRVSVMRHGKIVARYLTTETSTDEIARAMVGGELPQVAQREATGTQPCLSVRDLSAGIDSTTVSDLSFEVSAGEIVGIAGVEGNGQTALADAIAGMIPYTGAIEIYDNGGPSGFADGGRGAEGGVPFEPRGPTFARYRAKVGIVPQDRHHEGLVLNWSIVENAILGRQNLPGIRKGALTNWAAARADAEAIIERFDVRAASADVAVRTLSGGNQQKLLVGRALLGDPRFVLAYQPTRGIDVGAAALVQSRLIEARNRGSAILLISFELDEILAVADRVLVMFRGKITGSFSGAEIDRGKIGRLMAGLT
jgi:simple sugar transport system ATP-binding protein